MMLLILACMVVVLQPVDSLDALRDAMRRAKPGDRVVLATGTYSGSVWLEKVRGEEGKRIVIAGEDPQNPPVIDGTTECLHLAACEWITIEHLVLKSASGNGINIDDGGDLANPANGITLRSLTIRDIGPEGNCDGIKLSGLLDFKVEKCTIERWGSGGSGIDMVGCRDGVIEACTLVHDGGKGGSGVQLKGGTRDVVVRDCTFKNAGSRAVNIGGSTGLAFFRPKPEGFEAKDITVEGCTIVGSDAAFAFVGVDGAIARFNTIYHPRRWVMRILQETRVEGFVPSRGGVVTDNVIVFDVAVSRNVNVGDGTDAGSFVFERNVWYCDSEPSRSRPTLPSVEKDGIAGEDPRLKDPANGDFTPAKDGPGAKAGANAKREAK
jgi:hypothetical protein